MHKLGTWVCLSGTTRSCLLYDLIVLKITDPSAQYCYLCDASYNFTLVKIDQYGSTNDISALNLKMDPCHYPNQNIFQDVAYLNSRFTW